MSEVLKGNFKVQRPVEGATEEKRETLTDELERKLLSRLGGSVCYVKDKPFIARPTNGGSASSPLSATPSQPSP